MTEIKVAAGALAVSALFLAGVTLRPEARVARLPLPASITLGSTGTLWSGHPAVAKTAAAKVAKAIAASLVEVMDGQISVSSTHGAGTTFTITLQPAEGAPEAALVSAG